MVSWGMAPCVRFEDEHLLVVHKPAGWNTHAPSPYAGEGIYDWLRHREPRWASLAILHRLDKETSGVLVFGKTALANRSLTEQFTRREVHKKYLLLTDRAVPDRDLIVKTTLLRLGEKYGSRPGGEPAETRFTLARDMARLETGPVVANMSATSPRPSPPFTNGGEGEKTVVRTVLGKTTAPDWGAGSGWAPVNGLALKAVFAEPFTGRTHQIRVHAAENGFPILGDTLYGGSPAARVFLHAAEISFAHPATGEQVTFSAPADFAAEARLPLRAAIIEPSATDGFRLIHGASDGWPGWFVERLGDFLLSQAEQSLSAAQTEELTRLMKVCGARGAYHKVLSRQVRRTTTAQVCPQPVLGEAAPERFELRENGVRYELSFAEGYSVGLFLDQRDNRRRFLTGHIAADFPLPVVTGQTEVLNVFAYTCGFSVCAARAGARTTSLDLSKKYLEWGRRNFTLNGLDPAAHDFIFGDAFDWLRRLAKKGRAFDAVVLDPPTFSQSKENGVFRADKDYGRLVAAALPLVKPGGVLLASTNAADWPPEDFLEAVQTAVRAAGRKITKQHYVPQPPDFPVSREEPAYLKTVWVRVG